MLLGRLLILLVRQILLEFVTSFIKHAQLKLIAKPRTNVFLTLITLAQEPVNLKSVHRGFPATQKYATADTVIHVTEPTIVVVLIP